MKILCVAAPYDREVRRFLRESAEPASYHQGNARRNSGYRSTFDELVGQNSRGRQGVLNVRRRVR